MEEDVKKESNNSPVIVEFYVKYKGINEYGNRVFTDLKLGANTLDELTVAELQVLSDVIRDAAEWARTRAKYHSLRRRLIETEQKVELLRAELLEEQTAILNNDKLRGIEQ